MNKNNIDFYKLILEIKWPQIQGSGDPNTIDVYFLAVELKHNSGCSIQSTFLEKKIGVNLVEIVEANLFLGESIRTIPVNEIADRLSKIAKEIENTKYLKNYNILSRLIISLLIWHGCINMSKCLRKTHVTSSGEKEYDLKLRQEGYNHLNQFIIYDNDVSNWVRFGVSISRVFSEQRGNEIIDDWVPKDSPYWG